MRKSFLIVQINKNLVEDDFYLSTNASQHFWTEELENSVKQKSIKSWSSHNKYKKANSLFRAQTNQQGNEYRKVKLHAKKQ
jgi:hypothetical protein